MIDNSQLLHNRFTLEELENILGGKINFCNYMDGVYINDYYMYCEPSHIGLHILIDRFGKFYITKIDDDTETSRK